MAIKSIRQTETIPAEVRVAYNGSGRFIDAVMKELAGKWNIKKTGWVYNGLMPKNSAIIYDKYDEVLVNEINGKIKYRKITKEERRAAMLRVSAG